MTGRLPIPRQRRVLHQIPPLPTPPSLHPLPLSLARVGRSARKVRWRLRVSPGNDESVPLSQLPLPFKTDELQNRNQYNTPPLNIYIFFFSFSDFYLVSHGHCTHSLVVFRQVAPGNTLDFSGLLLLYCLWNAQRLSVLLFVTLHLITCNIPPDNMWGEFCVFSAVTCK